MPRGRKKKTEEKKQPKVEKQKENKEEFKEPKRSLSEKDKAAEHLVSLGYHAKVDHGVVLVLFEKGQGEGLFEKVEEELKKIGYEASFGIRPDSNKMGGVL